MVIMNARETLPQTEFRVRWRSMDFQTETLPRRGLKMGDDRLFLPFGTPSASEAPTRDQTTKNLEWYVLCSLV